MGFVSNKLGKHESRVETNVKIMEILFLNPLFIRFRQNSDKIQI